jgi:hypothetical protein
MYLPMYLPLLPLRGASIQTKRGRFPESRQSRSILYDLQWSNQLDRSPTAANLCKSGGADGPDHDFPTNVGGDKDRVGVDEYKRTHFGLVPAEGRPFNGFKELVVPQTNDTVRIGRRDEG